MKREGHSVRDSTGRGSPVDPLWSMVVETIVDRVVLNQYPQDSMLPTEAQLSAEFGVSRSVIREAVKILSEKGILRIDRGNGTRVLGATSWRTLDPTILSARLQSKDAQNVLSELFVIRSALEPELASLAARRITPEEVAVLKDLIATMERSEHDAEAFREADQLFHETIVRASGVELAVDLFVLISRPLKIGRSMTDRISGSTERAIDDHRRIVSEIEAHDPKGARKAMERHLDWAKDHLRDAFG